MRKSIRRLLAATCFASGLALPGLALAESLPLRFEWPQVKSDIAPDPAARFGRLPNGMTYFIYKNGTPAGTVSVHLRVAAGSLAETDNERGLAHFVEHMAFEGSINIPSGDLLPLLQRRGVKFGPDANAFTLPHKTEYVLDLPGNGADSLDTAMEVMREVAGNLLFSPDAVERERANILGEERLRQTPPVLASTNWLKAAFPGQAYATRGNPIGLPDIIKTASPEMLRGLYHAIYRPELTTLIVVGDIDPDQIEARIKATFSDWQAAGPARSVDYGEYHPKGLTTYTFAGASIPDTVSLAWFSPLDTGPADEARSEKLAKDLMLLAALNQRLQHEALKPDCPFSGAYIFYGDMADAAMILQLTILPKPGQARDALVRAHSVMEQFKVQGITAEELAPIMAQFENSAKTAVSGEKTRTNDLIAQTLGYILDANAVFTSPSQELERFEALAKTLSPKVLNAQMKSLFSGDGPLLSHTAETLGDLDDAGLKQAYAQVAAAPAAAYVAPKVKPWPYTDFGPAQGPVSKKEFKQFGFMRYTFANGVKVNILPTKFKDDEVLVSVGFNGGLETLGHDTDAPLTVTGFYSVLGGILGGGLGKLDLEQLQLSLAGKTVGAAYWLGDDTAVLNGTTNRKDLATQIQLMMALASDPAYRPEFYDRFKVQLASIYTATSGSPQGVLGLNLESLSHVNDRRFRAMTVTEAQSVPFERVRDLIKSSLTDKPIEITLVGDLDPEEAIKVIGGTFATLSKLPEKPVLAPDGDKTEFPKTGLEQTLYHAGRPDQSLSLLAFPLPGNLRNTKETRGLEILTEALNVRVFETVRAKLGQAYDANASRDQSWTFKDYGMLKVSGSVATGQDEAFQRAVEGIIDDLKTHPLSQDELDRARKPLVERWTHDQKDNQHWMYVIPHIDEDKTRADSELKYLTELNAVTPQMVMELAGKYLVRAKALHVKVLPHGS